MFQQGMRYKTKDNSGRRGLPAVKRPGERRAGGGSRPGNAARNMTPAHETDQLAELVCSIPLAPSGSTAPCLLKAEMVMLGSLLLECAAACRPPGRAGRRPRSFRRRRDRAHHGAPIDPTIREKSMPSRNRRHRYWPPHYPICRRH